MKKIAFILICIMAFSCNNEHTHNNEHHQKKHDAEAHENEHSKHGSANDFMHQSSTQELIDRFESKDRDAYQKPGLVLNYLGKLEGLKIMDIGAGSGYFTMRLAEKGAHVIAADVDEAFLNHIKERISSTGLKTVETRKIPYDAPNLEDSEVDKVLVVNTYHHIENRPNYFKKVKNGINETGELVIIDFFKADTPAGPPTHHKIAIDTIIDELKKAGFSTFNVNVDLLPYQYIIRAK